MTRYYEFTEEQSSNVRKIGYDLEKQEMPVVFKDLKVRYVYENVAVAVAGMVIFSESVGYGVNKYLVRSGHKFRKENIST